MVETRIVTVDGRFGEKFKGEYELRQITQGEYERVLVSYMDAGGRVPKQDLLKVSREAMWSSIIRQPEGKPISKDELVQGRLPYGLGLKLQAAYDAVNGIEVDESRFLSSPSEEKDPIQS